MLGQLKGWSLARQNKIVSSQNQTVPPEWINVIMPVVSSKSKHHTGNREPHSEPASQRAWKERLPDRKIEVCGLNPDNAAFLVDLPSSLPQRERNCGFEELMTLRMAKKGKLFEVWLSSNGLCSVQDSQASTVSGHHGAQGRDIPAWGTYSVRRFVSSPSWNPDIVFHMARGLLCPQGAQKRDFWLTAVGLLQWVSPQF